VSVSVVIFLKRNPDLIRSRNSLQARFRVRSLLLAAAAAGLSGSAAAQDSVDVTFTYRTVNRPSVVYLAGEFNRWADNSAGRITSPAAAMSYEAADDAWEKTVRLRLGGPDPLPDPGRSVPGAYQYKFNENGSADGWKTDPLNPRQNPNDMGNSLVFPDDPTLFRLLPNMLSGVGHEGRPEISVYVFPAVGSAVDTAGIRLRLDGTEFSGLGSGYDPGRRRLRFTPPLPLRNGEHRVRVSVPRPGGGIAADSAQFRVQWGTVRFLTIDDTNCLRAVKSVEGVTEDASIASVVLHRNADSTVAPVSGSRFSRNLELAEGENRIWAAAVDGSGVRRVSDTLTIVRRVDHAPRPVLLETLIPGGMLLTARGNDPDGDRVRFVWGAPSGVPVRSAFGDSTAEIRPAGEAGECSVEVSALDPDGNNGRCRALFRILPGGAFEPYGVSSNPRWVRDAVVYEIYLPAFTPEGTLAAAEAKLPWIKELGANTVWLMPVYDNGETVNETNAGYNVVDFRRVHPQFGTNADLESFFSAAHGLGLKVILDSTPNHVSENHPWVAEAARYGEYANSRPIVEERILGDARGMGQSAVVRDGDTLYVRYDGWALANLNYQSPETRFEMVGMYKWWLERGADGFRMDVYWGPQNRYGSAAWWKPFRDEIKRVRPEAFILGETDGTGSGTESNYADGGGACDAAYDWNFYNRVRQTLSGGSLDDLDDRVRNFSPDTRVNYYTGPNARYFRFLENHDEQRIAGQFAAGPNRAAAALLLTAPGIPMVYAGQEVGETSRRGLIRWDRPDGAGLSDWYRRLCAVRRTFPCFRSDDMRRVPSGANRVYAFLRPDTEACAVVAIQFAAVPAEVNLSIDPSWIRVHGKSLEPGRTYVASDLIADTDTPVTADGLASYPIRLPAYGCAVLVFSDAPLRVSERTAPDPAGPVSIVALSAFPNPFNGETAIRAGLHGGRDGDSVSFTVYDLLGNRIRRLSDAKAVDGQGVAAWDGRDDRGFPAASGVYLCRVKAAGETGTVKMTLIR
jgi:glycosidase